MRFIEFSPANAWANDFLWHPEGPHNIIILDYFNPILCKFFE